MFAKIECAIDAISVHLAVKYRANGKRPKIGEIISAALACGSKPLVLQGKEFWLGGLDSNQDTQSQSLVSYQLDDLPADGSPNNKNESQQ